MARVCRALIAENLPFFIYCATLEQCSLTNSKVEVANKKNPRRSIRGPSETREFVLLSSVRFDNVSSLFHCLSVLPRKIIGFISLGNDALTATNDYLIIVIVD